MIADKNLPGMSGVELIRELRKSDLQMSVLLMTGYRPDLTLLRSLGVPIDPESGVPAHDEATMATPVPGVYIAGVIAGGYDDNRLFIENTRHHGDLIVADLLGRAPGTGE